MFLAIHKGVLPYRGVKRRRTVKCLGSKGLGLSYTTMTGCCDSVCRGMMGDYQRYCLGEDYNRYLFLLGRGGKRLVYPNVRASTGLGRRFKVFLACTRGCPGRCRRLLSSVMISWLGGRWVR